MAGQHTIETELQNLSTEDEDAKEFWHLYSSIKDYLNDNYYKWIQAKVPYFTDHGEGHINSVIRSASELLEKHIRPLHNEKYEGLNPVELFILLSAIIWHDVGNALQREGHEGKVSEMTEKIGYLAFPDIAIKSIVVDISRAHTGEKGLKIPQEEQDISTKHGNYTIYPRSLAAIVRLADEISENQWRISKELLSEIPKESQIYWEYANCITSSRADIRRNRIVISVNLQVDKALTEYVCNSFRDRVKGNGKMLLLHYLLCRLEKMNNERAYCTPHFAKYANVYEIAIRISMLDGTDKIDEFSDVEFIVGDGGLNIKGYPNIKIFDEFFTENPDWDHLNLLKQVKK